MPNIYGPEQPWTKGDITANIVPLSDTGVVVDDAEDGTVQTELGEGQVCEREETITPTITAGDKPLEDAGGTISNKVGDTPIEEGSAGTVENAVTDQDVLGEVSGTVDTKVSDEGVTEDEAGTTNRDVADDSATQEEAGIINRELGLSSCII
jgi:hypothetical protein